MAKKLSRMERMTPVSASGDRFVSAVNKATPVDEKAHKPNKDLMPYPEMVREGAWQIADSYTWKRMSGVTNIEARKMVVPTSKAGSAIRLHEMGHARWSPTHMKDMRTVSFTIINAVEDARINDGLNNLGMGLEWGEEAQKQIAKTMESDLQKKDYGMALLRSIGAIGTDLEAPMKELMSMLPDRWARAGPILMNRVAKGMKRSRTIMRQDVARPEAMRKLSRMVAKELARLKWEDEQEERELIEAKASIGKKSAGGGGGEIIKGKDKEKDEAPLGDGAIRDPARGYVKKEVKLPPKKLPKWEPLDPELKAPSTYKGFKIEAEYKPVGSEGSDTTEWVPGRMEEDFTREQTSGLEMAKMYVTRPELSVPQVEVRNRLSGTPAASEEGTMIRRPDRLLIDRAIFAKKRKRAGATILVDASGSMDITAEEIERVVIAAGCDATVAMYCGSGRRGELRIVAEGPSRCSDEDMKPRYGGNVVDLQALQWLSTQTEPRLWMSDGHVTSSGDIASDEILEACNKVAAYYDITRHDHVEEIIAHLEENR